MGGKSVEVRARSLQFHVPLLTRGEVTQLDGSELVPVGKMDLDSHVIQGFLGGVLDGTFEGVRIGIVRQYQPSTVPDLIVSFVQSELFAGFFTFLAFMTLTVFFLPFTGMFSGWLRLLVMRLCSGGWFLLFALFTGARACGNQGHAKNYR
jgi:hypothetical protein